MYYVAISAFDQVRMTRRIVLLLCFVMSVTTKEKALLEVRVNDPANENGEFKDYNNKYELYGQFSVAGVKLTTEGDVLVVNICICSISVLLF